MARTLHVYFKLGELVLVQSYQVDKISNLKSFSFTHQESRVSLSLDSSQEWTCQKLPLEISRTDPDPLFRYSLI